MKNKFLSLVLLTFLQCGVYASPSLSLSTNTPTITAGSPFSIQIIAEDIESLDTIKIPGIEKLQVLGQQVASNIQVINGAQSTQQKLSLQVVAGKEGNLTIGPVTIQTQSGVIQSPVLTLNVQASIQSLQSQLKAPRDNETPLFPWKQIFIATVAILAIAGYLWKTRKQDTVPSPKTSIIESIHARPDPQPKTINWLEKIPHNDDPLFAENAEHVIRNYLQSIRNTNVYHLTYQELLQLNSHQQGELRVPMESLRHALMILQKARYAKLDLDKQGLKDHMTRMFS